MQNVFQSTMYTLQPYGSEGYKHDQYRTNATQLSMLSLLCKIVEQKMNYR